MKDALRFSTVTTRYIEARSRKLRASSMRVIRMHLTGDYFAALHSMPIDTIKRANVAACLTAIGSDPVRRQMRTIAMTFFAWCMTEGLIESNPVIGTAQPDKAVARNRVLERRRACRDLESLRPRSLGHAGRPQRHREIIDAHGLPT